MLRLAIPVLVEQSLHVLVSISDMVLTGQYFDQSHLAAVNLMSYLLWLITDLFLSVGIGSTALTARFTGSGDLPLAQRVTNQSLLVGMVVALTATLLGLFAAGPIVRGLELSGSSAQLAGVYLRIVSLVIPLIMIEAVGIACLRGVGDTRSGMWVMTGVNLVNIAVSWSLVLGLGPLPKLGWQGIAVGTACGHAFGGLAVLALLLGGRSGMQLRLSLLVPDRSLIRRILRIGVPGGIDVLTVVACQLWFVSIVNTLGDLAAAAHGVAIKIEALAYLPGTAFQVAAATLAGQYLGAGDRWRAGRSVIASCLAGGGVMCAAGLVFFFGGRTLSSLIVNESQAAVIDQAVPLLRIVAMSMPALAITMVLTGALRGAGDTRWPLAITLAGYIGVRLPGTYLLVSLGYGVEGAWYAMVADLLFRAPLVMFRFRQGGWMHVSV